MNRGDGETGEVGPGGEKEKRCGRQHGEGQGGEGKRHESHPRQLGIHTRQGFLIVFPSISSKSVHLPQLPSISQGLNPMHCCRLFMEA